MEQQRVTAAMAQLLLMLSKEYPEASVSELAQAVSHTADLNDDEDIRDMANDAAAWLECNIGA